jgi:hypothetical protein
MSEIRRFWVRNFKSLRDVAASRQSWPLWWGQAAQARRRIIITESVFERDKHKVIDTVNDIVGMLKSRGIDLDPLPLESPNYDLWNFKFAVKVKVPTARKA